jgi:hypothetical protein
MRFCYDALGPTPRLMRRRCIVLSATLPTAILRIEFTRETIGQAVFNRRDRIQHNRRRHFSADRNDLHCAGDFAS